MISFRCCYRLMSQAHWLLSDDKALGTYYALHLLYSSLTTMAFNTGVHWTHLRRPSAAWQWQEEASSEGLAWPTLRDTRAPVDLTPSSNELWGDSAAGRSNRPLEVPERSNHAGQLTRSDRHRELEGSCDRDEHSPKLHAFEESKQELVE